MCLFAGAAFGIGEDISTSEWVMAGIYADPEPDEMRTTDDPMAGGSEPVRGSVDGGTAVPLPSAALLGGAGLAIVASRRRRAGS